MKKDSKRVSMFIVFAALIVAAASVMSLVVHAAVTYNNTVDTNSRLTISSSGTATVKASYTGYQNVTTGANVVIVIQKKLPLVWFPVANGSWEDDLTGWKNSVTHTLDLSTTGKYRAVFQYTVSGSGGTADVIQETEYCDYN